MFIERYREALALKSLDVEEFVDLYFHRPIAALVAAVLLPLPVTPNQVTLAGLTTGWIGAVLLYLGFFGDGPGPTSMWLAAGAFFFVSMLFDCADGQLARARGGGSRVGRILDGLVDVLVLLPTYVIIGVGLYQWYGGVWLAIAAVAGFSTWIHCLVYDKLKNQYLAKTKPDAGGADGTETIEEVRRDLRRARDEGSLLERVLLWLYVGYLQVQDRFASGSTHSQADALNAAQIEKFRRRNRPTMRMAAMLGLGTHWLLIYGSIFLMAWNPDVMLGLQIVFATFFNVWMCAALWRARHFSEPVPSAD